MADCRDTVREALLEVIEEHRPYKALAARVGMTEAYVCMLSNRKQYPSLSILTRILDVCECELQVVKKDQQSRKVVSLFSCGKLSLVYTQEKSVP